MNFIQNYKSIISNFLSLSSLQMINYLFPLITFPYIISIIGLEKFGILSLAIATTNYFSSFVDFGFNISATRDISKYRHNRKALNLIYSKVMSVKLCLLALSSVLYTILIFNIESFYIYKEVYFFSFSIIVGTSLLPLWFYMGIEDMKYIAVFNFISKLVFLLLLFLFLKKEEDFWIVPLLTSIGAFTIGIISVIHINKKYKVSYQLIGLNRLLKEIKSKYEIFLIHYIPIVYSNAVYTMLGIFTDNATIGIYSVVEKVMMIFNSFLYLINNSFYPTIVKDISKFNTLKNIMFGIGIFLTTMVYFSSFLISDFLVGNQTTTYYIELISLTFIFTAIYATYGLTYIIVKKQDKILKKANLYISVIGIGYTFFLILVFGLVGAVVSVILTRMLYAFISRYLSLRI